MTPAVAEAVDEVGSAFAGHDVEVEAEPRGGAYVTIRDLNLGPQYTPSRTCIGFLIGFHYPHSDVYPHFTDPKLTRVDGRRLGQAFQQQQWRGRPAIQISRRSNRWSAETDTAALKLQKVLDWIRAQ